MKHKIKDSGHGLGGHGLSGHGRTGENKIQDVQMFTVLCTFLPVRAKDERLRVERLFKVEVAPPTTR